MNWFATSARVGVLGGRRVGARLFGATLLGIMLCGALLLAGCSSTAEVPLGDIVGEVPFPDGETLSYELIDRDNEVVGRGTLTANVDAADWRFEQIYTEVNAPRGERETFDRGITIVRQETLYPVSIERVIQRRDETRRYEGVYAADRSSVDRVEVIDGDREERSFDLREHAYENESALWLWRTLPLSTEYEARYVSMNVVDGAQQTVSLLVTETETITVPAGTFETWRLQVRTGRATNVAWIEQDAPHRVIQWDSGSLFFRLLPEATAE